MKQEDLRIGNSIYCQFEDQAPEIETVTVRVLFDLKRAETEKDFKFLFSPIDLTEEWLLKFGFENHSPGLYRIKIQDHQSRYLETMISVGREFWNFAIVIEHKHKTDDTEVWIRGLRNVNELQNLYFSLTGKELVASI